MESSIYEQGQVLLINKPLGWTSFDAVRKIRNLVRIKKVGHAGTLDPLATGLLIICTGAFTKKINDFTAQEKEYTGTLTLGASTVTYDLESDPFDFKPWEHISQEGIQETTKQFIGAIAQVPPAHSAIKTNGKRAYELARKGKEFVLEPRIITIKQFDITEIALPRVGFRVICSTGTYIRSLAHDFGKALGCGAYLSSLCRTRIGNFKLADSLNMEEAEQTIRKNMGS